MQQKIEDYINVPDTLTATLLISTTPERKTMTGVTPSLKRSIEEHETGQQTIATVTLERVEEDTLGINILQYSLVEPAEGPQPIDPFDAAHGVFVQCPMPAPYTWQSGVKTSIGLVTTPTTPYPCIAPENQSYNSDDERNFMTIHPSGNYKYKLSCKTHVSPEEFVNKLTCWPHAFKGPAVVECEFHFEAFETTPQVLCEHIRAVFDELGHITNYEKRTALAIAIGISRVKQNLTAANVKINFAQPWAGDGDG